MSRAEEKAEKVYPAWRNGIGDEFSQNSAYYGFIEGYHQAEKDLELTWEDIEKITDIWDDLHEDEAVYSKTGCDTPEFYKEILKRFKDFKERKEK